MYLLTRSNRLNIPWNKGKLVVQKRALTHKEIWSIRIRLQMNNRIRLAVSEWITLANIGENYHLFKSRFRQSPHISTRQYARIVSAREREIGLDPADYGTHSLRRTKASLS